MYRFLERSTNKEMPYYNPLSLQRYAGRQRTPYYRKPFYKPYRPAPRPGYNYRIPFTRKVKYQKCVRKCLSNAFKKPVMKWKMVPRIIGGAVTSVKVPRKGWIMLVKQPGNRLSFLKDTPSNMEKIAAMQNVTWQRYIPERPPINVNPGEVN